MDTDQLVLWVMKTDRRLIVMKTIDNNSTIDDNNLIKASDIATKTGRSLQNISLALRELEKYGLVKCITPEKSTWKRFIFTKKGIDINEKLRKIGKLRKIRLRN